MIFAPRRHLFLFFLGISLTIQPYLCANVPTATSQKSWTSTLNEMGYAALYFVPAAFSSYEELKTLSASHQKELLGDQKASDQTIMEIHKLCAEMAIKNNPEIIAMRDTDYRIVFDEEIGQHQAVPCTNYTKNFLGVHATNACIFIDEKIINFEKNNVLSTFLVKYELARYKKNYFSKVIVGNVTLTMAQAVALYKMLPVVTHSVSNFLPKIGWTSFNDPQQGGIVLGISRFTLNYLVCPRVTQMIIDTIKNNALTWYTNAIHVPFEGSWVSREQILPLLGELIKLMPDYEIDTDTQAAPSSKKLLDATLREVCLMAQNRYHLASILATLDTFMKDAAFSTCVPHVEKIKKFFNDTHRTVAL